mmetsp:Transcript_9343/g.16827  ORF Transcript_9343/g.16827 Transcript_9343/m.16827 type:complete len:322 (-) Transcript_9343:1278-2243(-)
MLRKALPGYDRACTKQSIATLACAMANSSARTDASGCLGRKLLAEQTHSHLAAEAMLRDDHLGASARRHVASMQSRIEWQCSEDARSKTLYVDVIDTRSPKRARILRCDFNNPRVPGCLRFVVAGQHFYGSAHIIRGTSRTLCQGLDAACENIDHPELRPIHLLGPASIPEDSLHELFCACMQHAYYGDDLENIGVDPLLLLECARWLQMDELCAECVLEIRKRLAECGSAHEAAKTLDTVLAQVVGEDTLHGELVEACAQALIRHANSKEVGDLLCKLPCRGTAVKNLFTRNIISFDFGAFPYLSTATVRLVPATAFRGP